MVEGEVWWWMGLGRGLFHTKVYGLFHTQVTNWFFHTQVLDTLFPGGTAWANSDIPSRPFGLINN